MRKTLLLGAAALAALPLGAPAQAGTARGLTPIAFSSFFGVLSAGSTHSSTYCQEVLVDVYTPATCSVTFEITSGRLSCAPDDAIVATATGSYSSHGAGVTVGGIPLNGVVVQDTGMLRGHLIEVPGTTSAAAHVFTMVIKSGGVCENGVPTSFVGEVQYL